LRELVENETIAGFPEIWGKKYDIKGGKKGIKDKQLKEMQEH